MLCSCACILIVEIVENPIDVLYPPSIRQIDAELPAERQQFIAKDSEAQFILSTSDLPCFSLLGSLAIDVNDPAVQEVIEQQSAEALLVPDPDDLSYILYTSGKSRRLYAKFRALKCF